MKNNIEKHRRQIKMTMQQLADIIGTDASTINKIEKGKISANQNRLIQIADALGVTVNDLIYTDDDAAATLQPANISLKAMSEETESGIGAQVFFAESVSLSTKQQTRKPAPIPVLGSAAGSHIGGAFQIADGPIDWIDVPRAFENAKGIYALYVNGISMEPMFPHGSKVLVSEHRPARIGDTVVVQEEREYPSHGIWASIGILDSITPETTVLKKLNPSAKVNIPSRMIKTMHRVVDYQELLNS